jgi:hypothetical protein
VNSSDDGTLRRTPRAPATSSELRRRTATNDGVEQCTGELERWDAWVGGRKERGSAAFYREQEGEKESAREFMRAFVGLQVPSIRRFHGE